MVHFLAAVFAESNIGKTLLHDCSSFSDDCSQDEISATLSTVIPPTKNWVQRPVASNELLDVLDDGARLANTYGVERISVEHVLEGILDSPNEMDVAFLRAMMLDIECSLKKVKQVNHETSRQD